MQWKTASQKSWETKDFHRHNNEFPLERLVANLYTSNQIKSIKTKAKPKAFLNAHVEILIMCLSNAFRTEIWSD